MSKSVPAILRTVGLWVMMGFISIADVILYQQAFAAPMPIKLFILVWAIFWSCIILLVVAFEIWGKFFSGYNLTISNMMREWQKWEKENKKFPMSRVSLTMWWIAFTGLIVHLWFYGGM
jgi:hypothetical protein